MNSDTFLIYTSEAVYQPIGEAGIYLQIEEPEELKLSSEIAESYS